jgi:formylglycine-generating enzyme required for sulfatase activity
MPGAAVLLEGVRVGRIAQDRPLLLENVPAGRREIRVVDYSGREARRDVDVPAGDALDVELDVLELTSPGSASALVSIGENPQGFAEYWRPQDAVIAVEIPAGEFSMGSPDGEGAPDERPQRRVYSSAFLIDKTEVTWRQFRIYAKATGASLPPTPVSGTDDDYPIAFILWQEATDYCEWVGARLPTEAEWEKAARGTDGRSYAWGNAWDPNRCNSISGGMHRPEAVGSYPDCLSPYGVLDMSGSMWEWCSDRYGESYYSETETQAEPKTEAVAGNAAVPVRDPQGPTSGRLRVKRGGAWMTQPTWLRVAFRAKASPTSRNLDHGFRCAQDAPE